MAYTNVWTTAAPLDTQAANQGAVDFRATKLDVMQRIASFGAGLLASRPTPETTSASADWTGVMYWATDTKQTFRWNGSSWDDISLNIPGALQVIKFNDLSKNNSTNPPVTFGLNSVTIPTSFDNDNVVTIAGGGSFDITAGTPSLSITTGATTLLSSAIPVSVETEYTVFISLLGITPFVTAAINLNFLVVGTGVTSTNTITQLFNFSPATGFDITLSVSSFTGQAHGSGLSAFMV